MKKLTATGKPASLMVPSCYHKGARQTWHQRRRHRAVLQILSRVKGEVLDYGCGYGDLAHAIARSHPVQGVDVDPERIAFAAREYAPIRFSRCESGRLDFPDKSFDIVTSIAVIHFVPDPVQHLREARRVLRDHGHLLIGCSNVQIVRNSFRRLLGKSADFANLWIKPESEIRCLLKKYGFHVEADDYFYDPPLEGWKNPGDVFFGLLQQVLSVFRVHATCSFFLLLARKVTP